MGKDCKTGHLGVWQWGIRIARKCQKGGRSLPQRGALQRTCSRTDRSPSDQVRLTCPLLPPLLPIDLQRLSLYNTTDTTTATATAKAMDATADEQRPNKNILAKLERMVKIAADDKERGRKHKERMEKIKSRAERGYTSTTARTHITRSTSAITRSRWPRWRRNARSGVAPWTQ